MIRILFDGPPSHEGGRFIEVENEKGEGISFGEWIEQGDYWVLQFPDNREINANLLEALEAFANAYAYTGFGDKELVEQAEQAIEKAKE